MRHVAPLGTLLAAVLAIWCPALSHGAVVEVSERQGQSGRAHAVDAHMPAVVAQLDVDPGSCPNILNIRSEGVTPVALLGSADFHISDVDITTLKLEGIAPLRSEVKDVGTALPSPEECDCTTGGADGWPDLSLEFATQDLVAALAWIPIDAVPVMLTGKLVDGTPLEATDCVLAVAEPKTLFVRADGSGDVPTIQAAVNLLVEQRQTWWAEDTIVVEAGYYPETVALREPIASNDIRVVCPSGPSETGVKGLRFVLDPLHPWTYVGYNWSFEGLRFSDHVRIEREQSGLIGVGLRNCWFQGGFSAIGTWNYLPSPSECEFNGRVELCDIGGSIEGCRFVRATLHVQSGDPGLLKIKNCEFAGPVDTAVVARSGGYTGIEFIECTFSDARYALVAKPVLQVDEAIGVKRCRFSNIAESALSYHYDGPLHETDRQALNLRVTDTHFEGCGSALRWESPAADGVTLEADTILASGGDAVRIRSYSRVTLRDVLLVGSGGRGAVIQISNLERQPVTNVTVEDSRFMNTGADALTVHDPHGRLGSLQVSGNLAVGNAGDGIRVESAAPEPPTNAQRAITSNTIVLNGGRGLRVVGSGTYFADVERNLVVGNELAGLSVSGIPENSVRWNDAWLNGGGGYEGGVSLTDNLQLDPRFCNVYIRDYTVQESSPCAPSGPYGQIGAFGVGCTSSHVELTALRGNGEHPPNATGQLKVGLLGHRLFDPSSVDLASVRLGGAALSANGGNQHGMKLRDVNHDGIVDGVVAFRGDEMAVTVDGEAVFAGLTVDGAALSGGIEVREVGRGREAEPLVAGGELKLEIRKILPNPSRGAFVVEFVSPGGEDAVFELYDVVGRRVKTASLGGAAGVRRIEVRGLRAGVYFGVMKVGSESVRRRVVVR